VILKTHLPALKVAAKRLKLMFATIDKIQNFIGSLRHSIQEMEAQVDATEEQYSVISVQKLFSFFSSMVRLFPFCFFCSPLFFFACLSAPTLGY